MQKSSPVHKHLFRSFRNVVICTALVLAAAGGVAWGSRSSLFADATSVRPQTYTELYFADPANLPTKLQTDRTYHVSFAIANRTVTTKQYVYDVVVQTDAAIVRQLPTTVTVPSGGMIAPMVHFSAPVPNETLLVSISLEHTNDAIQLYIRP
jgi:hypothetical protein